MPKLLLRGLPFIRDEDPLDFAKSSTYVGEIIQICIIMCVKKYVRTKKYDKQLGIRTHDF